MPDPKKKGLAIVLGFGDKSKPEDEAPESSEDMGGDVDEAYHDAAEELVDAVKASDADRVVDAFKLLHQLCSEKGEE